LTSLSGIGALGITGHRPPKLGGYDKFTNQSEQLKFKMEIFFMEKNPAHIVSGMAQGTDQWAAEVALKLGIKVLALIPCTGHELMWPTDTQNYYRYLLREIEKAHGTVQYVSLKPYTTYCMHRRNQAIVSQSSEMLAVWDGTRGGTRDCVRLALADGLLVTVLHPWSLEFNILEKS
jgi:uncharacterized phage-like protein YoqJ